MLERSFMKNVQEKILDYIRAKESATFGELETVMTEAGFEWRGELFLCSHNYPNIIYWKYWNEQAVSLFTELINAGEIRLVPIDFGKPTYSKEINFVSEINIDFGKPTYSKEINFVSEINNDSLFYLASGNTIVNMPVTTSKSDYKTPHWLPCFICMGNA